MKSLPGNIWGGGNANNILVRPLNDENVCITAKVSLKPEVHGEQAGLLLYQDDNNYCKVVKEWYGGLKTHTIITAVEKDGKASALKILPFADEVVVLRMVKLGQEVICFVRGEKEQSFTLLSRTEAPNKPDSPFKLALYSAGAKEGADRWATFHSLTVKTLEPDADPLDFLEQ